jgi:Asp-tRNA(Asn)/Glu-tRNA(Gln) amidotransferase A subunit family amidase
MTLDDFNKVIDAKITELNEKVKDYLTASTEDIKQYKNATPHELNVAIELHKSYAASLKAALEDLKEICDKKLHKDYMVPTFLIETFIELARKVTTLHYVKLQPSHVRVAS